MKLMSIGLRRSWRCLYSASGAGSKTTMELISLRFRQSRRNQINRGSTGKPNPDHRVVGGREKGEGPKRPDETDARPSVAS